MLFVRPKYSATRGLRRSASTTITRLPVWVRTRARLIVVVVLPSPGLGLVTMIELNPVFSAVNCRLVRSDRNDSAATGGRPTSTGCFLLRTRIRRKKLPIDRRYTERRSAISSTKGISPRIDTAGNCVTRSSRLRRRVSSISRRNAMPRPNMAPSTKPRAALRKGRGDTGVGSGTAGVMTDAPPVFNAASTLSESIFA